MLFFIHNKFRKLSYTSKNLNLKDFNTSQHKLLLFPNNWTIEKFISDTCATSLPSSSSSNGTWFVSESPCICWSFHINTRFYNIVGTWMWVMVTVVWLFDLQMHARGFNNSCAQGNVTSCEDHFANLVSQSREKLFLLIIKRRFAHFW